MHNEQNQLTKASPWDNRRQQKKWIWGYRKIIWIRSFFDKKAMIRIIYDPSQTSSNKDLKGQGTITFPGPHNIIYIYGIYIFEFRMYIKKQKIYLNQLPTMTKQ